MADTVTLNSKFDDAAFAAYHLEAKGERRGGVIVVQEIFGIDAYVKADCARWSDMGFEVLAPSMFDRQEPGFVADHTPEGLQQGFSYVQANGWDNAVADIETCVDWLMVRGPVYVVGYCYGGSAAYLSACKIEDLAAVSCYYGSMIPAHAGDRPLCPTICHFGRLDAHIPISQVENLRAHRPDVAVYDYEAGHGFNNEGAPGYAPEAAELARQRTLSLFQQNGAA